MRARTELLLATATLASLITIAAVSGRAARDTGDDDPRRSSYGTGPDGFAGFAETAQRMGVPVARHRRMLPPPATADKRAIAVSSEPINDYSEDDAQAWLLSGHDLLLAGSDALSTCAGYRISVRVLDSLSVARRDGGPGAGWTHAILAEVTPEDRTIAMASGWGATMPCPSLTGSVVDTLLATADGSPVMVTVPGAAQGTRILVLADASLLSNSVLRRSSLGPWLIATALDGRSIVLFDEFRQGYSEGGSLAAVVLGWSRIEPTGWILWQIAIAGLLAFVAGAVRSGPVTAATRRARRSPREHVRALATALSAARGHDVAIGAIVRGLQRRLGVTARSQSGGNWRNWVDSLESRTTSPAAREHARELGRFTSRGQSASAVKEAANRVEDLWEALRK
ncbi:MAG: hypothetical protein ACT4OZ_12205 [Gemmatimonadota bacterium]